MALTNRLVASIYGKNDQPLENIRNGGTLYGRLNYFPNSGNKFYAAPLGTKLHGVT